MDEYAARGYGGSSVGFGERIGIAVVDFQLGFTDARFPLGGAALTDRAVGNTATLLAAARAARLPVVSCYTAYAGGDAPHWKVPPVLEGLRIGSEQVRLDPRIEDRAYDLSCARRRRRSSFRPRRHRSLCATRWIRSS